MALDYPTFVAQFTAMLAEGSTDTDFATVLPEAINFAEQTLYRELDLLNTVTRMTAPFVASNRNLTFPQQVVVSQQINVITPSTQAVPDSGTRNPLTPVTKEYLDLVWPGSAGAALPTNFAMVTDQTIVVGPWPDQAYTVEIVGTIRPAPLSATNPTTYLTLYLPDAFFAGAMIFGSAYQKNFGAASGDPAMGATWEAVFKEQIASANVEEQRKRYAAGGWTSQSPSPIATPPRS